MYDQYFGFTKTPFKITPDPELFFAGGNRGAVLDALLYAIRRGEGIVKVVGEVGSGKTMLCRMLERELPAHCEIIYLANPNLGPDEILQAIAFELRLTPSPTATKPELTHLLHEYLLKKHIDNRRVVMFVEEAQSVPVPTLEAIRMLSNLETAQDKLLQIVLFGQPELDTNLGQHAIRQLNERITYRFRLAPLTATEIRDYLNSRLRASGFRGAELFERGAIRALANHSRGLLRRINVLADKALLAAYSSGKRKVSSKHVVLAARDSELIDPRPRGLRWWPATGLSVLLGVMGAGFVAPNRTTELAATPPVAHAAAPANPVSVVSTSMPTRYLDLTSVATAKPELDSALRDAFPTPDVMPLFSRLDNLLGDTGQVLTFELNPVVDRW